MEMDTMKNRKSLMKSIIILSLLVVFMSGCSSHTKLFSSDKVIYHDDSVTVKAEFPGGSDAYNAYIRDNFRIYDLGGASQTGTGIGIYSYVITSTGKVKDVKIVQEVEPKCDLEMVRILKKMPKWNPATLNGKPVSVEVKHYANYRTAYDKMAGVDRGAYYPGGTEALDRALIGYCEGISGTVYVTFTIDENGKVVNPKVFRGRGTVSRIDARALSLVRGLKFVPAMRNGKPIPSKRMVAVRFPDTGVDRYPF